jgi:DNA-binding transcriptional ArsR family regulator
VSMLVRMPRTEWSASDLAETASLLADTTRAMFCLALMDGRAWTAGELARHAGVAASTTSAHLDRLVDAGLLAEVRQGRHRYLRLAGPEVAELVETLSVLAGPPRPAARSLRAITVAGQLAHARTCYDHLAGRVGVALTDAMVRAGHIDDRNGFALTDQGLGWLDGLGIATEPLRAGRRPLARSCLDWTERRPHLAGAAGAALCSHVVDQGWLVPIAGQRALRLPDDGAARLARVFDLDPTALAPAPASGQDPVRKPA